VIGNAFILIWIRRIVRFNDEIILVLSFVQIVCTGEIFRRVYPRVGKERVRASSSLSLSPLSLLRFAQVILASVDSTWFVRWGYSLFTGCVSWSTDGTGAEVEAEGGDDAKVGGTAPSFRMEEVEVHNVIVRQTERRDGNLTILHTMDATEIDDELVVDEDPDVIITNELKGCIVVDDEGRRDSRGEQIVLFTDAIVIVHCRARDRVSY
jgi:hypothetical protein